MKMGSTINDDDFSYICPAKYITGEQINWYAFLLAKFESIEIVDESILKEEVKKFGKDFKDVQKNINAHIEQCYPCKEKFNLFYELETEMFHDGEVLEQRILEFKEDTKRYNLAVFCVKRRNLKKRFVQSHLTKTSDIDWLTSLEDYITEKSMALIRNEKFTQKEDFEQHIKECNCCIKYYEVNKNIAKELDKIKHLF